MLPTDGVSLVKNVICDANAINDQEIDVLETCRTHDGIVIRYASYGETALDQYGRATSQQT